MDKTRALQQLLNGTASDREIEALRQALTSGEISIGGNVSDSAIVNGNENLVISNKEGTINIFVSPDKVSLLQALTQMEDISTPEDRRQTNGLLTSLQGVGLETKALMDRDREEQLLGWIGEYRARISSELEAAAVREDWSMGNFIKEEAKFLPINASPYRPDALRGEPVDLIQQIGKNDMTIVIGEPGSGKSVAVERFAWALANDENLDVPFLFRLTELYDASLLQRFQEELSRTKLTSIATIEYPNAPLKDIKVFVLLDGLNEVQYAAAELIAKEILQIKNRFPKTHIVVTSRIQDEGWRILQNSRRFETVVIQPIQLADARSYLENQLGMEKAKTLWESLDFNLREIIRTPLLLRMVKELAHRQEQGSKLPRNRGELYEEFIHTRMFIDRINAPQSRQILSDLGTLALTMQMQPINKLNVDEDHLFDVIKNDQRIQLIRSSGFILGEGRAVRFPHQTFQEFFVARAIRTGFKKFLKYSVSKEWTEIFVFLSGLVAQPDELLQAIYTKNVWLAWFCIQEGNAVTEQTRDLVEARSIRLISSPNVADRLAAAIVLAGMNLERCIPHLITLVKDDNLEVSLIARTGLKNLSEVMASEIFNEFYKPNLSNYQRIQLGEALGVTRDLRPGVVVPRNNIPDMDWVDVPEGTIRMGVDTALFVPAFQISRYIVTNSQFDAFLQDKEGSVLDKWWTESGKKYQAFSRSIPSRFVNSDFTLPNHPAIYVSWFEAIAFCAWLSAKLGYEVRLPSEHEWIRAAFADSSRHLPENDFSDINTLDTGLGKSTPVGSFLKSSSPFGVLDTMGNVFCWCRTKWRESLLDPEDNDLKGDAPRVLRGGSFTHTSSVNRLGDFPYTRHYFVGLRVACSGGKNE
jgi:formylglycine-generating enzyme required for sulfatase activity